MNDTVVLTYIYKEFWGTDQFKKSVQRVGLPLYNAFKGKRHVGDGQALKWIYEAYLELKDKYKYAIYSDGADTYFMKNFKVPEDMIIYSTEKAVWPPTDEMRVKWNRFWEDNEYKGNFIPETLWKYLNGGNCCGPIELLIEFFERYRIAEYAGIECNGQGIVAEAFLNAKADGFPIYLDTTCKVFQTTGFSEPGELVVEYLGGDPQIENMVTHTYPAVFHGNGRTNLDWIYAQFK